MRFLIIGSILLGGLILWRGGCEAQAQGTSPCAPELGKFLKDQKLIQPDPLQPDPLQYVFSEEDKYNIGQYIDTYLDQKSVILIFNRENEKLTIYLIRRRQPNAGDCPITVGHSDLSNKIIAELYASAKVTKVWNSDFLTNQDPNNKFLATAPKFDNPRVPKEVAAAIAQLLFPKEILGTFNGLPAITNITIIPGGSMPVLPYALLS
jgi:hypothetical protein